MTKSKIIPIKLLKGVVSSLKKRRKKIAFTNGCFDIIHYGHVDYLTKAKNAADILIIGLNSDKSVRKIKGRGRPIMGQVFRSKTLAALESVDYVTIFNETTPLRLIRLIRPDILIKGADWNRSDIVGADFVESYGGRVMRVALVKGLSTTGLITSIMKKNEKRVP